MFWRTWMKLHNWRFDVADENTDSLYTNKDIFKLWLRCKCLYFRIESLFDYYHEMIIVDCFKLAIDKINEYELSNIINEEDNPKTILHWYNMNMYNHTGRPKPTQIQLQSYSVTIIFFQPRTRRNICSCYKSLSTMSARLLHNY